MAHIPYGYRIEEGRAVPDREAAEKIRKFLELYLSGQSIKEANRTAAIPRSDASLRNLLMNTIYLGTSYYPPLMTAEVFQCIQEERARRTHPGNRIPQEPIPVKSRFIFRPDTVDHLKETDSARNAAGNATDVVGQLYGMITASEGGRETAPPSEVAAMQQYVEEKLVQKGTPGQDKGNPAQSIEKASQH